MNEDDISTSRNNAYQSNMYWGNPGADLFGWIDGPSPSPSGSRTDSTWAIPQLQTRGKLG